MTANQHRCNRDVHTCVTIQSYWDGDRLDLGRVGIMPHKGYLSEGGKVDCSGLKDASGFACGLKQC